MVNAFLALEDQAARAGAGDRIWLPAQVNSPVDLRTVLRGPVKGLALRFEPAHQKSDVPDQLLYQTRDSRVPDPILSALLKPPEKRALESVFDWPWISHKGLAGLLGVSGSRVAQLVNTLVRFELLISSNDSDGRLVLSDGGLAILTRREAPPLPRQRSGGVLLQLRARIQLGGETYPAAGAASC